MADSATVGILKTMLTMDTASYEAGGRKAVGVNTSVEKSLGGLKEQVQSLGLLAERMVKSLGGDKLLYTANSLTQAVTKLGGAQRLTESEQAKVNRTLTAAIEKYRLLGKDAPPALIALEQQTRRVSQATDKMAAGMAAMGAIGRKALDNAQASDKLIAGMSAAGKAAQSVGDAATKTTPAIQFLNTRMIAAGAIAGTFAAQLAGQAIRSVINMGREAFKSAGQIVDLSAKAALTTRTVQEMQFVASQTGDSFEAMSLAAFRLNVRIAGGGQSVNKAVRDLGLEFERLRRMSPDQMWNTVVEALSGVENATERNRIGTALFGRAFASISASIAQNYRDIAKAADVSSDAQLHAIDRAEDRWKQFVANAKSSVRSLLGEVLLQRDALRQVEQEQRQTVTIGPRVSRGEGEALRLIEAERRARLGLIDARSKDVQLSAVQSEAATTNVAQLAKIRAELEKLTAAQRKEIDAARELGGEALDRLEDQYGLTEGALRIYTSTMKEAEKSSKDLAKSQDELTKKTEAAAAAYRQFLNFVGEREIEDIQRANEAFQRHAKEATEAQIEDLEHQARAEARVHDEMDREAADWRQHQNFIGQRMMEDEAAILEQRKQRWLDFRQFMGQLFSPLIGAATGGLFSLVTGIGGPDRERAREAERDYERLRKSGTASAEAITQAFRRMKDEQSGLLDRFRQWTGGILREFGRLIDELFGMWIREFLGGLISSLARSVLGQRLGNWIGQALGFGPGIMGAAAGVGAAATDVFASSAVPASLAMLAVPGTAAAAGTAAATGTAAAAGGVGLGATIAGLATNPVTIIAAAALGAGLLLKSLLGPSNARINDQEWLQSRGLPSGVRVNDLSPEDQASFHRRLQEIRFGGLELGSFSAPNTSMPSLVTGASTAMAPSTSSIVERIGPAVVQNHVHNWHGIDGASIRRMVMSRDFTDAFAFSFENNQGFMNSRVTRAQRP